MTATYVLNKVPVCFSPLTLCQLFDFVDLGGFSLTLNPGFYDVHTDTFTEGAQLLAS